MLTHLIGWLAANIFGFLAICGGGLVERNLQAGNKAEAKRWLIASCFTMGLALALVGVAT